MATFNLPFDAGDGAPLGLSAWERFLLDAGIPESGCASLVAGCTREGNAIRSWVLANHITRYVPEHILEVLQLRKQLVPRWHREERQEHFPRRRAKHVHDQRVHPQTDDNYATDRVHTLLA
jgi:hypothetical protein